MAIDPNTTALWDQASTGAWKGFCEISAVIAQQHAQNPGLYPLIRITGSILTATGQNSTNVPQFEIVQWVQQPACFAPAAQPVVPAPVQQPVPIQQPMVQAPPPMPQPVQQPVAVSTAPAPTMPAPAGAWN